MIAQRLALCLLLALPAFAADRKDPILGAMEDELDRSRLLRTMPLAQPYYFEYAIHDGDHIDISATLGALVGAHDVRFRIPEITVRAGDTQFDSTNYAGGDTHAGSGYGIFALPLDDSYRVLRRDLWLTTDSAYKQALELLSLKRAALRDVTLNEDLPDFDSAAPLQRIAGARIHPFDQAGWTERVRRLSALFRGYPAVRYSSVTFDGGQGLFYLATSEGARIRVSETSVQLRVNADAQAPDGMMLHDAVFFHSLDADGVPPDAELERGVREVAANLTALAAAPTGAEYSGPVLFEGVAAGQLFAQVLGANLAAPRRPVTPPGLSLPVRTSELENRIGSRILPEWMDVVDDPTQSEWRGRPLFGHYDVDLEGVAAQRVSLVEKGVLKNFLLTRQPVKTFRVSNGHARLPGSFGEKRAGIGNLFVSASGGVSPAELRKRLIDLCRERNMPYGILIRKMDFPSTAPGGELRRLFAGMAQSGGAAHPVSLPVLVYRVYLDGHEQLVRGLRLRGLNARSLKDIEAASNEPAAFDYYDNGRPFAAVGAGSYAAESSVIAPSVLIDDVELERIEEELPKLPIVPAPALLQ